MQFFEHLMAEASADMTDVAPVIPFPKREGKRTEKGPRALRSRKAGNDDFLPFRCLDLEPVVGARA